MKDLITTLKFLTLTFFLIFPLSISASNESKYFEVETYPNNVSQTCRGGIARIYDECSDQSLFLNEAIKRGKETGKTVLVVYGAEWCIWCHVFDKYVKGHNKKFKYEWQYHDGDNLDWRMKERGNKNAKADAKKLNKFVSEEFILVHLESYHSPNGAETARLTGFDPDSFGFLPVIFSLNKSGNYASHMLAYDAIPGMEIRENSGRDYRGFDRNILLSELTKLRSIALR